MTKGYLPTSAAAWTGVWVVSVAAGQELPTTGSRVCLVDSKGVTNELHVELMRARFPVFRYFTKAALSYEVGQCKPADAIYRKAIAESGVPALECVYLDDIAEYVEAGRGHGLRAVTYKPSLDVEKILDEE